MRDYLAARDLTSVEGAGGSAIPRLPYPLPAALRRIAVAQLTVFSALFLAGALFVIGSGIAVIVMPFALGRQGVGTAMITLFLFCVVAVVSGIMLLAARSAARVLRREFNSVRALYLFVVMSALASAGASAVAWWLVIAFLSDGNGAERSFGIKALATVIVPDIALVFYVVSGVVLRRFR